MTEAKDRWDKGKILVECAKAVAEVALAGAALYFTVTYDEHQRAVADSNLKIAASNVGLSKSTLKAGLIAQLSSNDPTQRVLALALAREVDADFAAEAAAALALRDPSSEVRETAGATLGDLASPMGKEEEDVRKKAERGLQRYDVAKELVSKGLAVKLEDANALMVAGNDASKQAAWELYRDVGTTLSPDAAKHLDEELLRKAHEAEAKKEFAEAAEVYRRIFAGFSGLPTKDMRNEE